LAAIGDLRYRDPPSSLAYKVEHSVLLFLPANQSPVEIQELQIMEEVKLMISNSSQLSRTAATQATVSKASKPASVNPVVDGQACCRFV
jgi:hypothetical protein